MKKVRLDFFRARGVRILLFLCALYFLLFSFELPKSSFTEDSIDSGFVRDKTLLQSHYKDPLHEENEITSAPIRPSKDSFPIMGGPVEINQPKELSQIERSAREAWSLGLKALEEVGAVAEDRIGVEDRIESCPGAISMKGLELLKSGKIMHLPCGLRVGSSITLVGRPRQAHQEKDPKISVLREGASSLLVSQFMLELQGLNAVDGEDPPRILHFNPRLKGDWSDRPVIELNTCYRMQWATSQRCEGWRSKEEDETVDSLPKCEKWITNDDEEGTKETKSKSWLNHWIWGEKKSAIDWPYPFVENKLFVLTLNAGVEGYHISVDGRHVTSFPYRTGFVLEDATGFSVNGDIDVHTIVAASLPPSHSSYSPQKLLDMSDNWKAPPLPEGPVDLFIGILSAGNHFAERMAVRKTWMQSKLIRSSKVVARFFVAMNARKDINIQLRKEADFYGDMIIVPFMDNYELVVLKTVAICEYGIRNLSAKYIMKCDDDNFVRVDAVLKEVNKLSHGQDIYIGNLNYYHKPLRVGKWAVTYEEWPEEDYPPYANGPGYIISSGIARFIVSQHNNKILRLFKMEDVSMGMWVEQFNASTPVLYSHNWKFCQFGCIEDYITAHYQSPRQMFCMWDKLSNGKAQCCNMR